VFVERLTAAECLPVLLPPLAGAQQLIAALDGLLLLPGPDVDPAFYAGAAGRHPETHAQPARDTVELALLAAALDAGLPVLGICRGVQLLNILHQGTLYQHLPEVIHHDGHLPGRVTFGTQRARLLPGSTLARILNEDAIDVQCHHHQAIDQLGTGLTATAWTDDGMVEAVEADGHPFAVAVQWHAERDETANLFLALAQAARQRARVPIS
jgi:putative glutamine amidotransferase